MHVLKNDVSSKSQSKNARAQLNCKCHYVPKRGARWLSGIVLDSGSRGCGFEPHRKHCVVSLSNKLVLIKPRKTPVPT